MPEKSKGHQYDKIILPNIALLTASSVLRYDSKWMQLLANGFLTGSKPFKVEFYIMRSIISYNQYF